MPRKTLSNRARKTKERIQFIANNPNMTGAEVGKRFGISAQSVFSFKHVHKKAIEVARRMTTPAPLDLTGYEEARTGFPPNVQMSTVMDALFPHRREADARVKALTATEKEHAEQSQPKYLVSLAEMLDREAKTLRTTSGEQELVAAQLRRIADAVERRI
jgi:hypothetical protein